MRSFACVFGTMGVPDDIDVGYRNEALADHLLERGQEALDLLVGVDDRDRNRKVRRGEEVLPMNPRARAVSFDAAIGGRAGQILAARFFDDRLVQRLPVPAVVLAKMNPDHFRPPAQRHDGRSVFSTGSASRCVYLITSTSDSTTSPSCIICSRTGRYARIFASSSTTESMIGRSLDRLMRFSLWNRRCAPYPQIPRYTVTPAMSLARRLSTIASYSFLPRH